LNLQTRILQFSKKTYSKIFNPSQTDWKKTNEFDFTGQAASDIIRSALLDNKPCMIARIGSGELELINAYNAGKKGFGKYIDYIKGNGSMFWWDPKLYDYIFQIAGLFPLSDATIEKFAKLMLEDIQQIDILGSWLRDEDKLKDELKNAVKVRLADLEPYYHANPWSEVLANKKVLVIHPFADTIQKQYRNRLKLFKDERVLPEFKLVTIKAVQSIANNKTEFANWFDALNSMKAATDKVEFDVAIIGCGAYGLPLAAHIKRSGRKAVHLGGATQALFGIIGKRWEGNEVAKYINPYWVRPSADETPDNFSRMENGCYW
jgi:hypothetical protein